MDDETQDQPQPVHEPEPTPLPVEEPPTPPDPSDPPHPSFVLWREKWFPDNGAGPIRYLSGEYHYIREALADLEGRFSQK